MPRIDYSVVLGVLRLFYGVFYGNVKCRLYLYYTRTGNSYEGHVRLQLHATGGHTCGIMVYLLWLVSVSSCHRY